MSPFYRCGEQQPGTGESAQCAGSATSKAAALSRAAAKLIATGMLVPGRGFACKIGVGSRRQAFRTWLTAVSCLRVAASSKATTPKSPVRRQCIM